MISAPMASLFGALGLALALLSAAVAVLWREVRSLRRAARDGAIARRLDDLDGRHLSLEARLARVEAASGPGRAGRRVDRGAEATPAGPTLIAVPNLASAPSPRASAELDRRYGGVWAMADSGMPAEAIARRTGHPIGQVELILGLRRGRVGPDA